MVTLLVLAVPAGVLGISQTAQAQLGEDIANSVLDSVFGTNADDGSEEEEGATETEEEEEGITGDDNQDIDQTQEQTNEQAQTASQPITQESSQDETNEVANDLHTGDNTATVAQPNDATQEITAAADASDADASAAAASAEDDDDDHKDKKRDSHYSGSSDSTSGGTTSVADADAIVDAAAEATGIVDQNNTADVDQDSSVHDIDLSNNVAFAEDTNEQIAIPITDQDQRAANLASQRAANLDLEDIDEEYGFQQTGTEPITRLICDPSTLAGIPVTLSGSTCSATGDPKIITGGVCDAVGGIRTNPGGQNPQATCSFPATEV